MLPHQTTGAQLLKCPGGPYPPKKTLKNEMSPEISVTRKKPLKNSRITYFLPRQITLQHLDTP